MPGLNVRSLDSYGDIEQLANSIFCNGIDPFEVIVIGKKIFVKDGHRRYKAITFLVDDEEATILVEKLMLEELGYTVFPARSGKRAIELYNENKAGFDLVALDMIMPEMNGKDTYGELKKINPEVRVLLVSVNKPRVKNCFISVKAFMWLGQDALNFIQ